MKKIFFISILALATVVGCSKKNIEPVVDMGANAAVPTISVTKVTDDAIEATVATGANTGYYAYVVLAGKDQGLDAETLLEGGYSKKGYDAATVLAKDKATATVSATGLDFASLYTIYAVAANEKGVVTEVAVKEVRTSDGVAPDLDGWDFDGNYMELYFSEPVVATEGATITATVWAKLYRTGNPVQKDVVGEIVAVESDGTVCISFPDIEIPGSWYIINYAEGTFKDLEGNDCPALPLGAFQANESGVIAGCTGVYGYIANAAMEYELDAPDLVVNYDKYFLKVKVPNMVNNCTANLVDVAIVSASGSKTVTTEYTLSGAPYYGALDYYTVVVKLAEEPNRGDNIYITIQPGAITDIYGNSNETIEIGPMLYAYDYTIDDIVGTYTFTGTGKYGGSQSDPEVVIATNAAKDSVFVYNLFRNTTCCDDFDSYQGFSVTEFDGVCDFTAGTVTLDYNAIGIGTIASYGWNDYVLALGFDDDDNHLLFTVPEAGRLVIANSPGIYVYCNNLGWWDYITGELRRISTDQIPPIATLAVREKPVLNYVERNLR